MCDETRTTKFIAALLRTEEPDLVVITGDSIIAGAVDPLVSLTQLLEPIVSYGKPWAVVFGNHDEESGVTRTEMLRHLHSLDSENGCTINGPVHLPGVGNYNLTVLGDDGAPILSLLMLDSGNGRNRYGGYDWINVRCILYFIHASPFLLLSVGTDPVVPRRRRRGAGVAGAGQQ